MRSREQTVSGSDRKKRGVQGERRIVTILFCDVAGSTAMAEQLDPEEWAEIMNEAFDYMIAPIRRYGGNVTRLMGDAVLALFGAPIAHEDDPQRAVLAGLDIISGISEFRDEILDEYGLDFNVRVGINTGPVVVGDVGNFQHREYTALGDAINLAARMEQTAQPGSVQITADTCHLVAPRFDVEPLGRVSVKGKEEPVQTYQVMGVKTQPGKSRGLEGHFAPLIGRETEMEILVEAMSALRQGRGQIVCLIGEAGLGKSRLIEEAQRIWAGPLIETFSRDMDQARSDTAWLVDVAVSYDVTRPYSIFLRRLSHTFGVQETDSYEQARSKLSQFFVGADLFQQPFQRAVEALLSLDGDSPEDVGLSGEVLKREIQDGLFHYAQLAARRGPLVLVYDDIHWADPASIDLLTHLLHIVESEPVLIICAFRPYRQAGSWKLRERAQSVFPDHYAEIVLEPLPDTESSALVSALLDAADLSQSVRQLILSKADGNPFFIEEVIRELIAHGVLCEDQEENQIGSSWRLTRSVDNIVLPDSLQALLTARIDRLTIDSRRVLQIASVIGRNFAFHLLEAVAGEVDTLSNSMEELQNAELIDQVSPPPNQSWTFRHDLTRVAAYETILHRQRRRYHRLIAQAMKIRYAERLDPEAHLMAYHFEQAGDKRRALQYYVTAARFAERLYANSEAADFYEHALQIAGQLEVAVEDWIEMAIHRGRALELDGRYDEAISGYTRLQERGHSGGSLEMQLAAIIAQTTIYATPTACFNPDLGRDLAFKALALAQTLGDHRAESQVYWNLMLVFGFLENDSTQSIRYGEMAANLARKHGYKRELAYAKHDLARRYFGSGLKEMALSSELEAAILLRDLQDSPILIDSLCQLASGYFLMGDYDEALPLLDEASALASETRNDWGHAYALVTQAPIYFERGQIQGAITAFQEAVHYADKAGFAAGQLLSRGQLAWIYGTHGMPARGYVYLDEAREVVETLAFPDEQIVLVTVLLDILGGDLEKASKRLVSISGRKDVANFGARMIPIKPLVLNEFDLRRNDYSAVIHRSDQTLAYLHSVSTLPFTADLWRQKAIALIALGRYQEAQAALQSGYEIAKALTARRSLWPIALAMARLAEIAGRTGDIDYWLREARAIVTYLAEHMSDELNHAFYQMPDVRRLLDSDHTAL